jgi:hypothetical protein
MINICIQYGEVENSEDSGQLYFNRFLPFEKLAKHCAASFHSEMKD